MQPTRFRPRTPSQWRTGARSLALGQVTGVIGIVNVTPDSFSEQGEGLSPQQATERALRMFEQGAAIVDIGGESTRPGRKETVSTQQEIDRVLPVVEGVLAAKPDALLSVDSYRAGTAAAAVEAGVVIVNDVSGFLWDPAMAETCARLSCGVILMHTRGRPEEWASLPPLLPSEVRPLVARGLHERLQAARMAGVAADRIVLDPGFGFGKAYGANYPLLAGLGELREFGRPLLAGVSRKSFLARTLRPLYGGEDAPVGARENATLAAVTAAVLAGADLVRVHDVARAMEAVAVADAVLAAST